MPLVAAGPWESRVGVQVRGGADQLTYPAGPVFPAFEQWHCAHAFEDNCSTGSPDGVNDWERHWIVVVIALCDPRETLPVTGPAISNTLLPAQSRCSNIYEIGCGSVTTPPLGLRVAFRRDVTLVCGRKNQTAISAMRPTRVGRDTANVEKRGQHESSVRSRWCSRGDS
jgi:hypothetical protein